MKKQVTCFHLELKETKTHEYFGSIASICEFYKKKDIGITAASLYRFNIEIGKPFSNKLVIIRKGVLNRKIKQKIKE